MSADRAALLRAYSLLLCLVAGSWQLSIKEFVVPKAIELGHDAELRCRYELDANETENLLFVKWWWTPESTSSDGRKPIYQRIAGQKAQIAHNSSNIEIRDNDTIVLRDVTPVDSGTYECEVFNNNEVLQHQKLIVFSSGTGPVVNVSTIEEITEDNKETKLLLIECHAKNVAPKPILSISVNRKEVNITTIIENDDRNGFYSAYANTTLSNEATRDGIQVRCEIFYADPNIAHPVYVDETTFVPPGRETQSTTEMPEDTTVPEATPESLQSPNDGVRLHSSWILLTAAAVLAYLQTIL